MGSNGGIRGAINTPTASAASGRWSVREMFLSVKGGVWPKVSRPPLPATLNPDLWLDASDTSTITESGGAVSQWNNKGSLGNFTQATGAVQPTTGATTLNGLNVIDFAADYMTADDTNEWKFLHDGTDYIVAAVWKAGNSSNPNTLYTLLANQDLSWSNVGLSVWYDDRVAAPRNNALLHRVHRGVTSTMVVSNVSADGYFAANAFGITTILSDPNNATAADRSEMFFNSGTAVKNNTDTGAVSSANPTYALQIGASGNNNYVLTGSLAELIIVSGGNATETNRAALRDYLNDKWAVY